MTHRAWIRDRNDCNVVKLRTRLNIYVQGVRKHPECRKHITKERNHTRLRQRNDCNTSKILAWSAGSCNMRVKRHYASSEIMLHLNKYVQPWICDQMSIDLSVIRLKRQECTML